MNQTLKEKKLRPKPISAQSEGEKGTTSDVEGGNFLP